MVYKSIISFLKQILFNSDLLYGILIERCTQGIYPLSLIHRFQQLSHVFHQPFVFAMVHHASIARLIPFILRLMGLEISFQSDRIFGSLVPNLARTYFI